MLLGLSAVLITVSVSPSAQEPEDLEIRDFLSSEFEPIPLADVMQYLRAREQTGVIRLARRP